MTLVGLGLEHFGRLSNADAVMQTRISGAE
jgi:hypothetical protein